MDGIHDLGGMAGFGPVEVEPNEPTFHEPWESKAFRLNLASIAVLRAYNTDEYRHALERMEPVHYLRARYYERVLIGVTTLLVEKNYLDANELEAKAGGRIALATAQQPNTNDGQPEPEAPRFAKGDRVRVRNIHPPGHTRVPQYVRGHSGEVVHVTPPFRFPDASAHNLPNRREATYHVEFSAQQLWSQAALGNDSVVVDLWESYLEEVE
ncbi:MAG: nitrile hydratase subunit beta [Pseudomonadales bacterium]